MTENNFQEKKGFSFRKELSNMINRTKDVKLPNFSRISYNAIENENFSEKINYNKLYMGALTAPLKEMVKLSDLSKYKFGQN